MNSLEIIDFNGQKVIDSRVVAERIEMRHADLLEKIRNYDKILLNGKFRSVDFFIKSEYEDTTGRKLTCYLLTKQGCEMIANKLTGEKGILFTAEYVQAFNTMEQRVDPLAGLSDMELLERHYRIVKEVNEKAIQNREEIKAVGEITLSNTEEIKEVKDDIKNLKQEMVVNSRQERDLLKAKNRMLISVCGGNKQMPAYGDRRIRRAVTSSMWNQYWDYFQVSTYKDTPAARIDEAVNYIETWVPDTNLRIEIAKVNQGGVSNG